MSSADKAKLDDWQALLRQTEMKVVVTAACNAGTATALGITDATVKAAGGRDIATAFTKGGDMMINLIALTMMCDANRVIILQWPGFVTFTWDGMNHTSDHHGLSHRNGTVAVGGTCAPAFWTRSPRSTTGTRAATPSWSASSTASKRVIAPCSTTPAVMWLPELADGNAHNNNNLPIVIAGSAGGYLKQGVSVNLDTKTLGTGNSEASCANGATTVSFNTGSNTGNVPLNKLHVTLLNAIGSGISGWTPVTSFGTMDTSDVTKGITNPGELTALKA